MSDEKKPVRIYSDMRMPFMIRCACYGEAVAVEADDDTVDLAFWQYGRDCDKSWRTRIRHIAEIIRNGFPYTDMVVLYPDEAEKLGRYLIEQAKEVRLKGSVGVEEPESDGNHSSS